MKNWYDVYWDWKPNAKELGFSTYGTNSVDGYYQTELLADNLNAVKKKFDIEGKIAKKIVNRQYYNCPKCNRRLRRNDTDKKSGWLSYTCRKCRIEYDGQTDNRKVYGYTFESIGKRH
jgi:ribosomal protein L37AE/L43A